MILFKEEMKNQSYLKYFSALICNDSEAKNVIVKLIHLLKIHGVSYTLNFWG